MRTLRTLDLRGNCIGIRAASTLITTLQHNPSIERLYLSHALVEDICLIELEALLDNNPTVASVLWLDQSDFSRFEQVPNCLPTQVGPNYQTN
jgi:hypothetical protein